jgi:dTDP-4-amino-4,6-dideoxygalactose transaminase
LPSNKKGLLMNVPMADLPAQHHSLKAELTAAFEQVMEKCQFGLGKNVAALETEIAAASGTRHGLGCNSGTDALLLALRALRIGPGDEVITTPFTFVATAEVVCLAGATPVFADIDPQTFNMDVDATAAKITPRTKAIMPVHLFGQLADMNRFGNLARAHNLPLIGDGAQAIGASRHGKPLGAWSDLTTLSFFPTKNLGACGDGGMVLTDSDEHKEAIRLLRFHGSGGGYFYKEIGYCSRLDEMQAALLRVKATQLDAWNEARRRNAALYDELLGGLSGQIFLPCTLDGNRHVFHQYTLRVPQGRRNDLQKHLAAHGVQSAVYYPLSLHLQPAYAGLGYGTGDLPQSEQATEEVLSLPIHPHLSEDQVAYAAQSVHAFFS